MHIHPVYFRREQSCFITAGSCPDLHNDISLVIGVLGKKQDFNMLLKFSDPGPRICQFLLGQFPHFLIGLFFKHDKRIVSRSSAIPILSIGLHEGSQIALFFHQFPESGLIGSDIGACKFSLDIFVTQHNAVKFVKHGTLRLSVDECS